MESLLAKKLKTFQKEFRAKHGREPKRSDIAKVPEMAAVYDTWMAMSGGAAASSSSKRKEKSSSRGSGSDVRSKTNDEKDKDKVDGHTTGAMPPPPTTPTKPRQAREHRTASASSTSQHPLIPQTPPRASTSSSSRLPKTPTSSSRGKDPFKTPIKPGSHGPPSTPGSGVKLRTPPAATVGSPSTHSALNNVDSRFHYNLSPSSFRKLVADFSPRKGVSNAGGSRSANEPVYTPRTKARKRLRGEEVPPTPHRLSIVDTAGNLLKVGSSSSQRRDPAQDGELLRPGAALGDDRPPKRRVSSRSQRGLGPLWGRTESDSAAQRPSGSGSGGGGGNLFARAVSTGSQPPLQNEGVLTPSLRVSSPQNKREHEHDYPSSSPMVAAQNEFNSKNFSGPSKAKKFRSLFDEGEEEIVPSDDGMDIDDGVLSLSSNKQESIPVTQEVAKKAQPAQHIKPAPRPAPATPLLLDSSSEESEGERKNRKTSHSTNSQNRSSANGSPSKAVFLRAYQRFGEMSLDRRNRALEAGSDSDSEAGPSTFGLLSPRSRRGGIMSSRRLAAASTSSEEEEREVSPSALISHEHEPQSNVVLSTQGNANPSRRYRSHLLSSRRQALARLLDEGGGASSDRPSDVTTGRGNDSLVKEVEQEMEEQWLRDQTNTKGHNDGRSGKLDDRKTWGGAKAANRQAAAGGGISAGRGKGRRSGTGGGGGGDFLLGKARRGMGDSSLGTAVVSDEEDQPHSSAAAAKNGQGEMKRGDIDARPTSYRPSLVFRRMGRSGVDDAEADVSSQAFDARSTFTGDLLDDLDVELGEKVDQASLPSDEDEDWASEVEEDQWGWGGELEDTDVV